MPKDERESSCCVWDVTIPADRITVGDLRRHFDTHCKKYAFQLEQGAQSGYRHYQCRVSLKVKSRKATLLGSEFYIRGCNISPTSNANKENDFYVLKSETRIDGPWTDKDKPDLKTVNKMVDHGLFPWQQQLIDETKDYDDRCIHVLVDTEGNIGKSAFTKYMWSKHNAMLVPAMYEMKDLMQFVMSFEPSKLYLIDLPRAMRKKQLHSMFAGIEELKNGRMYDTRYHGKLRIIDEPNIVLFTNVLPNMKYFSTDRWKLWQVTDKKLESFQFIFKKPGVV
jgi:hypothetical protein